MLKKKSNIFPLTDNGKRIIQQIAEEDFQPLLCGKYRLDVNFATKHIQHSHSKGSIDDYINGTDCGMTAVFSENDVTISCYADGGKTELLFDESELPHHLNPHEKELMLYALACIRCLQEHNIITRNRAKKPILLGMGWIA